MYRVLKFGGTSVANTEKLQEIAKYLKKQSQKDKLVVVVSAMNKVTDELTNLAKEISKAPSGREFDRLLSIGEQQTIALLALALNEIGVSAISLTADQLNIKSSNKFNNAKIESIDQEKIISYLEKNQIIIVAGFQAVTSDNDITTLGRGGSDTSAVALSASLNTKCEIYTDVEGIYTVDPGINKNAKKLEYISVDEMSELASLGAGVMHNRSIILAKKYNVVLYVAQSMSKEKGTIIMDNVNESNVVTALSIDNDVINFTISSDNNLLTNIINSDINIDMVSQVKYNNKKITAFSTSKDNLAEVLEIIGKEPVSINKKLSKISLVGAGMRESSGVISKIYTSLEQENIEIIQTSTSEITVSLLIAKEDITKAVKILSQRFNLEEE